MIHAAVFNGSDVLVALFPRFAPWATNMASASPTKGKTETEIWQMLDANPEKHIETVKRSRRSFMKIDQ